MPNINFDKIVEKLRQHSGAKNESQLARALKVSPQALFNAKSRREIPTDWILRYALDHGLSLDELFEIAPGIGDKSGEGEIGGAVQEVQEEYDDLDPATREALKDIQSLEFADRFRIAAEIKDWVRGLAKRRKNGGDGQL